MRLDIAFRAFHFDIPTPVSSAQSSTPNANRMVSPYYREVVQNGVEYPCSMGVVVLKRNFEHPVFHGALVFTN